MLISKKIKLFKEALKRHRHHHEELKHHYEKCQDGLCQYKKIYHEEFHRFFKYLRFIRPAFLVFNFIILYLLFSWAGTKSAGIFLAVLIAVKEIIQFLFFKRLEKGMFKPIKKLRDGVEEIAKGNYNIKVESNVTNEIGLLIDSFNGMAQKLYEGEQMKAQYEDNRKTLVANISHDLKTPITSIQGYIEAIIDGTVNQPEQINKYLKTIYNNTAYMNKLIDDLFLFSKLDLQKMQLQCEVLPVKAFMKDLMEEFKFELEEKGITFQYFDKLGQEVKVNIDRKRLYQAFRNIIGNAVKYGPETGSEIVIQLYAKDTSVAVDIKDNGPGIAKDKLPFVFERFYRIDTERTKDFMSTGLGLAIAKELVEAHSGEITVSSIEDKGSCFTIILPTEM